MDRGWTQWAIPVGIEGDIPVPVPSKPTIRRGSRGPYVVECQNDLIKLLYDVGPKGADGIFGAKTEEAVKSFQRDHDLKPDGIVGSATWSALDAAIGPPVDLFTVTIQHLDETQARELCNAYENATMKKE
jgi:peptidoglycan hydrolase-like protein with peptidoglycan-binding domain